MVSTAQNSEGKGHLTAQLAARASADSLVIRTGGPNAGHTVWDGDTEYKLRHLPTPIAVREDCWVALGARSVVNPLVLREELALFPGRTVVVDPNATILEPKHIAAEEDANQMHTIGSTRKGIGAARADRIDRVARTARDLWGDSGSDQDDRVICIDVAPLAYATLSRGNDVIIEAAQGFGLGLHTDWYPYCTSADCTALDALADARISPWALGIIPQVWMAVRPFPIRVAGSSGPLRDETTWGELGLRPEHTTVTNKVRRVGRWDPELVKRAAWANGVSGGSLRVGLMMADQVVPELAGLDDPEQVLKEIDRNDRLQQLLSTVTDAAGAPIGAIGTGPKTMAFAQDISFVGFE